MGLLEELDMIQRESNARRTLITVVNYGIYQDIQDTDSYTDKDTERTLNGRSTDTDSPQTRMNKNDKEKKNKGKISTFGNYDQRETQEDDIYTILSRKGSKK